MFENFESAQIEIATLDKNSKAGLIIPYPTRLYYFKGWYTVTNCHCNNGILIIEKSGWWST